MASVSSHILDSLSGDHAGGIRCVLYRIGDDDRRLPLFDVRADAGGRIDQPVEFDDHSRGSEFELVFDAADYFRARGLAADSNVNRIVLRFRMDTDRRYHLPIMLAPHSYSTWWSG